MADKYLSMDSNGDFAEVEGTVTSAGAGNAGDLVALDSAGLIDQTVLPTSGAVQLEASENLAAGDMINLWNDGGTLKARKADAASGKRADGFVNGAISASATGTVNVGDGRNTGVSGLTLGARYFLDDSGAVTTTPTTTTGEIAQQVGIARSATILEVDLRSPVIRA